MYLSPHITYPNFPGVERAHGQFVPMRKSHQEACFFAAEVRVKTLQGNNRYAPGCYDLRRLCVSIPPVGCPSLPANLINMKWPRNVLAAPGWNDCMSGVSSSLAEEDHLMGGHPRASGSSRCITIEATGGTCRQYTPCVK